MNTAIVTGAAQGVGLATSSLLARLGYRVVLTDIQALDGPVARLRADGLQVEGLIGLTRTLAAEWGSRNCIPGRCWQERLHQRRRSSGRWRLDR